MPFTLQTAIFVVLAVWCTVTIILFEKHLFSGQSSGAGGVTVAAVHSFIGNATQGVEAVVFGEEGYALFLIANYFGKSSLLFFRPTAEDKVQVLAELRTNCAHSWSAWRVRGRGEGPCAAAAAA